MLTDGVRKTNLAISSGIFDGMPHLLITYCTSLIVRTRFLRCTPWVLKRERKPLMVKLYHSANINREILSSIFSFSFKKFVNLIQF